MIRVWILIAAALVLGYAATRQVVKLYGEIKNHPDSILSHPYATWKIAVFATPAFGLLVYTFVLCIG